MGSSAPACLPILALCVGPTADAIGATLSPPYSTACKNRLFGIEPFPSHRIIVSPGSSNRFT